MTHPDTVLIPLPSPELVPACSDVSAWAGERAAARTIEFLTAVIGNPHTRRAYHRAAARFASWCRFRGLTLQMVTAVHVAAYVEELGRTLSPPSVKQNLAAIKHWFDHLVTGHALDSNPARAVRGPRYSQNGGKTPVLEREQARALLDSITGEAVKDTRDKALIAAMLLSYGRVGAVVRMCVRDYRGAGSGTPTLDLHEKGGKFHRVPVHHMAAELLDRYVAIAGLAASPEAPLWQGIPRRGGALSGEPLSQRGALSMMKHRCRAAGLSEEFGNHSLRATGLTLYLESGGDLESARQLANHASVKTTQLYYRAGDKKRRREVERVQL